ncbi:hypothetical protein PVAND_016137 [Polypedilum vanderplanki]|uniref:Uncharacterized protein n=1 Tax=Polypedilum vanderplanki TaxID=319348 RepID=A0A9J6BFB8_POLVA|nr:hypothetical protein PVAND_016137 [Polypedilum vanderplanki]
MKKIIFFLLFEFLNFVKVYSICPVNDAAICFTQSDFDSAFLKAAINNNITENLIVSSLNMEGVCLDKKAPIYGHFERREVDQFVLDQNRFTTVAIAAIQNLKSIWNLSKAQLRKCLKNIKTNSICSPIQINCDPSNTTYYRVSGSCNNKLNPTFGSKHTPLIRLLEDGYDDGYETMSNARVIESARTDSIKANAARGSDDTLQTETPNDMSTMAFQILTHELLMTVKTQITNDSEGGGFNCCNDKNDSFIGNLIKKNKYCIPISVKSNDDCYSGKTQCINYIRSFRSFDRCDISNAPSLVNFHTPYIDCELIYNEKTLKHLEENDGFFAFENDTKIIEILVGYDRRSMQLPGLLIYLSFYVRLHNNLVTEFLSVQPKISKASAMFEARRITCAVFQKLAIDLIKTIIDFKIPSTKCYDPNINPQVSVEFNIAFRAMHYFIRDQMGVYDRNNFLVQSGIRTKTPILTDQSVLIDNTDFYKDNKCGCTHGLLDTSWNLGGLGRQTSCAFFTKKNNEIGTDLRSWDFQSGREMGEPSYASYLQAFQGVKIPCDKNIPLTSYTRFDPIDLNFLINRHQNKLHEMSLSVGIDFEKRDNALGTATEFFIKEQLSRTICGDRFWYNHANGIFTDSQRDKINSIDFSQLLCMVNSCNGTRIQNSPFSSPGSLNRKSLCLSPSEIVAGFDLQNW